MNELEPRGLSPAKSFKQGDPVEEKSKSQVKREMLALQSLGEQLVGLAPDQIGKIQMPQELREAVLFARTLKRNNSLRRQMQYIGALMRDIDPEPIQEALEDISRGRGLEAELFQQLEQWRNELVGGNDEPMEDILRRFPDAGVQRIRRLVLNARKEKEQDQPPKSSRTLFRYLRRISNG